MGDEQISDQKSDITNQHIALVTGTLAQPAVRIAAQRLLALGAADVHVVVLNIQVAALMTTDWVARSALAGLALALLVVVATIFPACCLTVFAPSRSLIRR